MNAVLKGTGILIIALAGVACTERSITDTSQVKLTSARLSSDALPGAQVAVYFEPGEAGPIHQWYIAGPIHGQDDWLSAGGFGSGAPGLDHQVAVNTGAPYPNYGFGSQSLRLSNAVTSDAFGNQTFSKRLPDATGESGADRGIGFESTPGGIVSNHFEAQWDFASTVPNAEQPGLSVVASPDRGDGSRMSWVQMADTPDGLDINFFEVRGKSNPSNFIGPKKVASGLDRTVPHTIKITMDFVEGPSNDVVKVYVDGVLKLTGTSWENYYRYDSEAVAHLGKTPIVNRILFRTGGPAAGIPGKGFLVDNFSLKSADGPADASQCRNGGWQEFGWFNSQGDCIQSANNGK
jgi:hypothetical protein